MSFVLGKNPEGKKRVKGKASRVCVCVCVCVFIKLHITAQSGLVILVILCHSQQYVREIRNGL